MKLPTPKKSGDKYCMQIMIDGTRHYIREETAELCIAKAAAMKAGISRPGTNHSITLYNAIESFINHRTNTLSPTTIRGYRIIQRNRFQKLMNTPVHRIDAKTLQSAVNKEAKECSAKTLKNAVGLICAVIASETGQRITVTTPQVIPNEHPFLSPSQLKPFLDAIRDTDIEIPCLLGLFSCRRSELLALRWRDIDLPNKRIHINGAFVPNENNKFVRKDTTKNKTSRRTIPMCDRLYDLLQPLYAVSDKDSTILTINPETLRKRINRLCEDNGLPAIGIHGLRHSFASIAFSAGENGADIPIQAIMEIGGWSTDATLKKTYLHIAQEDKDYYNNNLVEQFNSFA